MSFDTTTFWVFFVVAWLLWRKLPFGMAKTAALVLSLVFYGWWDPRYVPLMVLSALVDYVAGARISLTENPRARKLWLVFALSMNLGLLAYFKYAPFVVDNARVVAGWLDLPKPDPLLGWVIPVGISFYLFKTMSYTIDVYRRQVKPVLNLRDFLLFVSFFPELVAGPIVRASVLLPQLVRRRKLFPPSVQTGFYHVVVGMFLKVVVADNLADPVGRVFDLEALPHLSPTRVWLGVVYFGVQIFADFAGYSSIAIGLAYLLGLRFPKNFNYPYISQGLSEFWRRWHISLSTWLRDYLYVPLGGNRRGRWRTYLNLGVTMLLGGLWHGASWNFVAWGGMHGLGLAVERWWKETFSRGPAPEMRPGDLAPVRSVPSTVLRVAFVFAFVHTAWVFFRAESFAMAGRVLQRMYLAPWSEGLGLGDLAQARHLVLVAPVAMLHAGQLFQERFRFEKPVWSRAVLAGVLFVLLLVVFRPSGRAFIYFQF